MPYVTPFAREKILFDPDYFPQSPGELNFLLTTVVHRYIKNMGEGYQGYNDVVGALECCKLELYRRKIAPYEDVKILENGDV